MSNDRVTIAEQYSRAMRSTHLEVKPDRGDLDMIVSAGVTAHRESLGVLLYRTRAEFDAAKRDALRAENMASRGEISEATSALAMVLLELKTLRETKQALGDYAEKQATLHRVMLGPRHIATIAGRALEWWLDPTCRHCQGRGFSGGNGTPILWCQHCRSTGRRHMALDDNKDGHDFGRYLIDAMDMKCQRVARRISRYMRHAQGKPREDAATHVAELQARLVELKRAEAQED